MSFGPRFATLATSRLARAREEAALPESSAENDARVIAVIATTITAKARARRRRQIFAAAIGLAAAACVTVGTQQGLAWRSAASAPSSPQAASSLTPSTLTPSPQAASSLTPSTLTPSTLTPSTLTPSTLATVTLSAQAVSGGLVLRRDGHEVPLAAREGLARGDRLIAAATGRASLLVSTGTELTIGHGGDVDVAALGDEQRFLLRAGTLHARVAKQAAGQRFLISTSDAEIEVRGTSFRVESSQEACSGSTTRVVVTEGVVVVRALGTESRVAAGEQWPAACDVVATDPTNDDARTHASPLAGAARGERAPTPHARPKAAKATPPAHRAPPTTELAEQNRAYAEATAVRRRGATREAVAAYEAFVERYPSSPLAESATVERMRVLASIDAAHGASAARDYLARWPHGFARAEASEIIQRSP